jgi:hypothetical protein
VLDVVQVGQGRLVTVGVGVGQAEVAERAAIRWKWRRTR